MPVTKPDSIDRQRLGPVEVGTVDLDGYSVDVLHIVSELDMKQMLRGLPDDRCQCPHYGVVVSGRLEMRYADRTEVFEAGDAYYAPPGHTPVLYAGTEIVEFSPTDELDRTFEVVGRNMEAAAQTA